jgi:hypothetical protein
MSRKEDFDRATRFEQNELERSSKNPSAVPPAANDNTPLAQDILMGASAIALYWFGDQRLRRRVYHLYATSNGKVGKTKLFFKVGSVICSRRSILDSLGREGLAD